MSSSVRPRIEVVERRNSDRVTTSLMGYVYNADNTKVPCFINNISDSGVMLEFAGNVLFVLAAKFEFSLEDSDRRYLVKLVWRKGRQIGVLFC